uniref:D-isomer specific 2-hydroxyacid dehydrogenase catalytic domain-containing protein n=1 Tax=Setaria viridis TaxID=4556 RepID=A0A4U6WEL3_SETVI|nr:LOW QUALITY PROTEIN: hypothetical protein SEVIR_1G297100v2 [Setaria viridis]
MAMRGAARQVASALGPHVLRNAPPGRSLHQEDRGVFYKGGEYADRNPNFVDCAENALGIRGWLESQGHQYVVTDDKDGPNSELEKHIADGHVLITTLFHPAYVTAGRIARAGNLELLLMAGIGSDHVDLAAAAAAGLTVAEVTGSNTVSVAEDQLMRVLVLVRNFLPVHRRRRAHDLEGKTVGAGRIGRLKPFGCRLLYHDRLLIFSWFNTGNGKGYGGDVWHPQPAPKDHPWRYMSNNAMTPHISGTTIDGQLRYAAGVKDMLERYFKGQDFPVQNYIVKEGQLAGQYQ